MHTYQLPRQETRCAQAKGQCVPDLKVSHLIYSSYTYRCSLLQRAKDTDQNTNDYYNNYILTIIIYY